MTTIRRKKRGTDARITHEAVTAYEAGDWIALRQELRLPPWLFGPELLNLQDGWTRRERIRDALREAVA